MTAALRSVTSSTMVRAWRVRASDFISAPATIVAPCDGVPGTVEDQSVLLATCDEDADVCQ